MRTIAGNGGGKPTPPLPETLNECKHVAVTAGFNDVFSLTSRGLYSLSTSRYYRPEQVSLHYTMRVRGNDNPLEYAIVYVIETTDGVKGTLTEPLANEAEPALPGFFREVETIRQQLAQYGKHQC